MRNKQRYCGQLQNHVRISNFLRGDQRNYHSLNIFAFLHGLVTWLVMQRSVWNDIVSWQIRRLSNSTQFLLHALMTTTSKKKKQNLLENYQIHALKLFWNTYSWQELDDLIFHGQWISLHDQSQNGPKPVTNVWIDWFQVFIILVNTNNIVMWVILRNNADWDYFKTLTSRWDLEDSKSTSGGPLCIFGSHTFVPISWMCKKQTSVSHSSTESEIISLDTGLRLDGLLVLEFWDLVVSVFGNISRVSDRSGQLVNGKNKSHKNTMLCRNIDYVPSNVQSSRQEPSLYVFEDNEAVIKMIY